MLQRSSNAYDTSKKRLLVIVVMCMRSFVQYKVEICSTFSVLRPRLSTVTQFPGMPSADICKDTLVLHSTIPHEFPQIYQINLGREHSIHTTTITH